MKQHYHRVLAVTALMVMLRMEMMAQALPYIAEGVIDTTDTQSLGLAKSDAVRTICVFSPTYADNHYANGVVLTAFKNALYCMWQSSKKDEDAPETCVDMVKARNPDAGKRHRLLYLRRMVDKRRHTQRVYQRLAQKHTTCRRLYLLHQKL